MTEQNNQDLEIQRQDFFDKKDLLTKDEIISIALETNGTNKKAITIAVKLRKYCFVNGRSCYILNRHTVTYRQDSKIDNTIIVVVSKLLEQSVDALTKEEAATISMIDKKYIFFRNSSINLYSEQLKMYLTMKDVNIDVYTDKIHFINGYVNLQDGKLYNREIGIDYVTKCVQYPYDESIVTKESMKQVKSDIMKTYPRRKDREAMMWKFGRALTGRSTEDQGIQCNFGTGASGKTTFMRITKLCLPPYVKNLKDDALAYNATNLDKVINTFIQEPQIRFAVCDDPKDKTMNESCLKNFASGEIDTIKLYQEGSHTVKLMCMLIIIMNTIPQTKIDSGIIRRFQNGMYEHKSKFVDNDDEVDEENHIYKKDKQFENKVKNDIVYKTSFCKYLFEHSKNTYTTNFVPSDNFINSFKSIINANNFIGDFITLQLNQTKDDKDRISKDRMHSVFKECYPDKHLNAIQLMSSLKDAGIKYEPKFRCDGLQGCFTNVKLKKDTCKIKASDFDKSNRVLSEDDEDPYENGVDKTNKAIIYTTEQQIEINKKQIEVLLKQNELLLSKVKENNSKSKQNKPEKIKKVKFTEDTKSETKDKPIDELFDDVYG